MSDPSRFYNKETGPIVLVGNGPSLNDIPDSFLRRFPTFACNSIVLRDGFIPTYYAAADDWVYVNCWHDTMERYATVPKFLLETMKTDGLDDGAVYRFKRREGPVWLNPKEFHPAYLGNPGLSFRGIIHAMIQIAAWMGYKRLYLVGCDNTGDGDHFYPQQLNKETVSSDMWEWAFDTLQVCLMPRTIINLSTRGKIECLAWADWKNL